MEYLEDYRIEAQDFGFAYIHVPSNTELLFTQSVSLDTLLGLAREFDTYGRIRPNWRER